MPRASNQVVAVLLGAFLVATVVGAVVGAVVTETEAGTTTQTTTESSGNQTPTPTLETPEPDEPTGRTARRTPEGNVTEIGNDPDPVAVARINHLIHGYRHRDEAVMVNRDTDLPELVITGIDPFPNVCWGENTVLLVTEQNRTAPLHRIEWDGRTIYLDRRGCNPA